MSPKLNVLAHTVGAGELKIRSDRILEREARWEVEEVIYKGDSCLCVSAVKASPAVAADVVKT